MKLKLVSLSIILMVSQAVHAMEPEIPDDSATFKITTSDEKEFELPYGLLKLSPTIKGLLEDLGFSQETPLPLPTTTEADFDNVKKTFEIFSPIAEEYGLENLQENIDAKQQLDLKTRELGLNNQQLIQLVAALDYLGMQPLVDAGLRILREQKLSPEEIVALTALGKPTLEEFWPKMLESAYGDKSLPIAHEQISGYDFDFQNNRLITWSQDNGTIIIWDLNNLQRLAVLPHEQVIRVGFSENYIISWSFDTVKIWDNKNFSEIPTPIQHEKLSNVATDYVQHLATSSFDDGIVKVWNLNNFDQAPQTVLHPQVSGSWFFDNKLITWSYTGSVRMWPLDNLIQDAEFSEIVSSSDEYEVSTTSDGKIVQLTHKNREINEPLFNNEGNNLVVIAPATPEVENSKTFVWDMNNLEKPRTITLEGTNYFQYFPDSPLLISYNLETIQIWDLKTFATSPLAYKASGVALDGNYLIASSSQEGTIKIWDVSEAPNNIKEIAVLQHPEVNLAMSEPTSHYIVSASSDSLKIWDFKNLSKKPVTIILGQEGAPSSISISDNLNLIALFGDGTIKIWDLKLIPFIENPTPDQILLYLLLYFSDEAEGLQKMSDDTKQQFKAILRGLPLNLQIILLRIKPDTVQALLA